MENSVTPKHGNGDPMSERYGSAKRSAVVGIAINGVLGAVKVAAGLVAGSVAVVSDGVDSFADVVTSFIVLIGVREAEKPPDPKHPYGHHKAEALAGRLVAGILILVAVGMIVAAVRHILDGPEAPPTAVAVWACLISIVVKESLFKYKHRVADETGSEAVRADAWNHRADVFSSIAALVGVVAAMMGGPAWHIADPIAAIFIALFVAWVGVGAFIRSTHDLMDAVPYLGIAQEIHRLAREVKGVHHTDDAQVRKAGMRLFTQIHVEVDPHITVEEGHAIATVVRDRILERFPHMADALVHIEPCFKALGLDEEPPTHGA